ncbi:MAG TPA: MoaD/ThiS family protein [Kiloniellaceae bacterium]|nr:MoaD/ThiS family protein [Kiloniellaceae bacterium]
MRITVKSSGLLVKHLPAERQGNSAPLEVPEGATPQAVMAQLGLPPQGSYLVILNGESLPKAERGTRALAEGDLLSIMPPLKGG